MSTDWSVNCHPSLTHLTPESQSQPSSSNSSPACTNFEARFNSPSKLLWTSRPQTPLTAEAKMLLLKLASVLLFLLASSFCESLTSSCSRFLLSRVQGSTSSFKYGLLVKIVKVTGTSVNKSSGLRFLLLAFCATSSSRTLDSTLINLNLWIKCINSCRFQPLQSVGHTKLTVPPCFRTASAIRSASATSRRFAFRSFKARRYMAGVQFFNSWSQGSLGKEIQTCAPLAAAIRSQTFSTSTKSCPPPSCPKAT
mmetsp:Transcript_57179/g.102775  ORF Transcript_57179/g.102775 Transcript_57179/m.102775 type:complete len:253 (-) Transcript_57179:555-1313(-)